MNTFEDQRLFFDLVFLFHNLWFKFMFGFIMCFVRLAHKQTADTSPFTLVYTCVTPSRWTSTWVCVNSHVLDGCWYVWLGWRSDTSLQENTNLQIVHLLFLTTVLYVTILLSFGVTRVTVLLYLSQWHANSCVNNIPASIHPFNSPPSHINMVTFCFDTLHSNLCQYHSR